MDLPNPCSCMERGRPSELECLRVEREKGRKVAREQGRKVEKDERKRGREEERSEPARQPNFYFSNQLVDDLFTNLFAHFLQLSDCPSVPFDLVPLRGCRRPSPYTATYVYTHVRPRATECARVGGAGVGLLMISTLCKWLARVL